MALLDAELDRMPVRAERQDELAEVFERYAPSVWSFFARRGYPPEDCRDLTQETFLKAHRGLGRFREEARLRTWILRIATNVWKNSLRSSQAMKRAAPTVSLDGDDGGNDRLNAVPVASGVQASIAATPLEETLRTEERRLLRNAVAGLPPRMKRCVLLRIDQGLKYREVAAILQVSVDTVKTQLFQARQRLRDRIGDYYSVSGVEAEAD